MAEIREVVVPDIGDFADVPVIEVLVAPGDSVAPEDPLVTLESDKATMDVPAPFGGTVAQIAVSVGDTVSEGSPILTLAGRGPTASRRRPEAPAPQPSQAGAVRTAEQAESAASGDSSATVPASPQAPSSIGEDGAPPYASPAVRRLAREMGVDLSGVEGSGRRSRITKEDVRAIADGARQPRGGRRPRRPPGWRWPRGRRWTSRSTGPSSAGRSRASRRSAARTWPATG